MRPTETPEYWQSDFAVTEDDMNHLYEVLVEEGIPRSVEELARRVVEYRQEVEEETLARQAQTQGAAYQPKHAYSVGQRLLFPRFGDANGVVMAVRPGENPEYGEFDVIQVQMDDNGLREFAARFTHPHPLNEDEHRISPDELVRLYGDHVTHRLRSALEQQTEFVSVGGQWFLADMLTQVHIGHLNIAEAVIDLAETPLPTDALLKQVDLPADMAPALQALALDYSLAHDPRFVNVGEEHTPIWGLVRQQAPEAASS